MNARRVVLASGNRGKLREFAELLADTGFELVRQSEFGIEPPPETGNTTDMYGSLSRVQGEAPPGITPTAPRCFLVESVW